MMSVRVKATTTRVLKAMERQLLESSFLKPPVV